MKTRWKFLREIEGKIKSDNGDCTWKINEWKKEEDIYMCHSGFHCSKKIQQAFSYVQGEIIAKVAVKGKRESQDDKEVYSEMKIVEAYKWVKEDSVALSIFAAELCLENFEKIYPGDKRPREAIEAAKKWIENPTVENESAARSAWIAARSAENAAWIAARSAARSAAESAARSAARSAESAAESAESAAESAARSAWIAARSAENAAWSAFDKIEKWMVNKIKSLEEIK